MAIKNKSLNKNTSDSARLSKDKARAERKRRVLEEDITRQRAENSVDFDQMKRRRALDELSRDKQYQRDEGSRDSQSRRDELARDKQYQRDEGSRDSQSRRDEASKARQSAREEASKARQWDRDEAALDSAFARAEAGKDNEVSRDEARSGIASDRADRERVLGVSQRERGYDEVLYRGGFLSPANLAMWKRMRERDIVNEEMSGFRGTEIQRMNALNRARTSARKQVNDESRDYRKAFDRQLYAQRMRSDLAQFNRVRQEEQAYNDSSSTGGNVKPQTLEQWKNDTREKRFRRLSAQSNVDMLAGTMNARRNDETREQMRGIFGETLGDFLGGTWDVLNGRAREYSVDLTPEERARGMIGKTARSHLGGMLNPANWFGDGYASTTEYYDEGAVARKEYERNAKWVDPATSRYIPHETVKPLKEKSLGTKFLEVLAGSETDDVHAATDGGTTAEDPNKTPQQAAPQQAAPPQDPQQAPQQAAPASKLPAAVVKSNTNFAKAGRYTAEGEKDQALYTQRQAGSTYEKPEAPRFDDEAAPAKPEVAKKVSILDYNKAKTKEERMKIMAQMAEQAKYEGVGSGQVRMNGKLANVSTLMPALERDPTKDNARRVVGIASWNGKAIEETGSGQDVAAASARNTLEWMKKPAKIAPKATIAPKMGSDQSEEGSSDVRSAIGIANIGAHALAPLVAKGVQLFTKASANSAARALSNPGVLKFMTRAGNSVAQRGLRLVASNPALLSKASGGLLSTAGRAAKAVGAKAVGAKAVGAAGKALGVASKGLVGWQAAQGVSQAYTGIKDSLDFSEQAGGLSLIDTLKDPGVDKWKLVKDIGAGTLKGVWHGMDFTNFKAKTADSLFNETDAGGAGGLTAQEKTAIKQRVAQNGMSARTRMALERKRTRGK